MQVQTLPALKGRIVRRWLNRGGYGEYWWRLEGTGVYQLDGLPLSRVYADAVAALGEVNERRAALGLAAVEV